MPLGLVLIFGGALLVIGAVRNEHPWSPIVKAFGGTPPPAPGSASAAATAAAISGQPLAPPGTAPVGSGSSLGVGDGGGSYASAAAAILSAGHWPASASNLQGLSAIIACEKPAGQPWQWNNPMNTEQNHTGQGTPTYGAVLSFPSPAIGALNNALTIRQPNFARMAAALAAGNLADALRADPAGTLAGWGTGPDCVRSRIGSIPNPFGGR
jgi:hypothetical protein